MYSVSISGWTLSYFFLQYLLDNAKLILLQYKQYVFGYIIASGLISFAFCYRFGPLTNPKTRNLIKWTLQVRLKTIFHSCSGPKFIVLLYFQFAGLALIFISSYLHEVTYMVDLLLLASRVLPISWLFSGIGFM